MRTERVRHLTIRTADNATNAVNVYEIVVTNGTLTNNGDGTVSITIGGGGGGSGFTIQEIDGSPSGTCTTFRVPNTFLTNDGGGQFTLSFPASYTDEQAQDAIGAILTDSSTIDFSYNDSANTITASVIVAGLSGITESQVTNLVSDLAARVLTTRQLNVTSPITGGGDLSSDRTFGFDQAVALGNNARVTVRRNTGADVGTRRRLNFIEGSNVTLTIADDAGNEEVDITINSSGGGGGSGSAGQTTLDFGTYPGGNESSVSVTGQTGIVSGSIVQAWIAPIATADHSADEHLLEPIKIIAGNIIAGTGFTIYGFNDHRYVPAPVHYPSQFHNNGGGGTKADQSGQRLIPNPTQPTLFGQFTVNWRWS